MRFDYIAKFGHEMVVTASWVGHPFQYQILEVINVNKISAVQNICYWYYKVM